MSEIQKTPKIRLGVDLGGTKIEIIALDENGQTLLRERVKTPAGDYAKTIDCIVQLVDFAENKLGQKGSVGVGIPGSESLATGLIKNANSNCLIGKALRGDLENRLNRQVRLQNDANCLALSEATDGAGAGAAIVFAVILGTGNGGGIVVNRHVLQGANSISGEWGHNQLPYPEEDELHPPKCYCGKNGCIETWLSGPGLVADHLRHNKNEPAQLTPIILVERAKEGDAICEASLKRYERRLAKGLAHVINIVDPEVVVLGGGISNMTRLYENVPKIWGEYIFSDEVRTKLLKNVHGDSSGVRGAAWLWNDALLTGK